MEGSIMTTFNCSPQHTASLHDISSRLMWLFGPTATRQCECSHKMRMSRTSNRTYHHSDCRCGTLRPKKLIISQLVKEYFVLYGGRDPRKGRGVQLPAWAGNQ